MVNSHDPRPLDTNMIIQEIRKVSLLVYSMGHEALFQHLVALHNPHWTHRATPDGDDV